MKTRHDFLPVNKEEMQLREWDALDFLFISGDAYVDHPSFGHAIITRVLENGGYRVGIIPQPNWRSTDDFRRMGRPRFGVMISAGNLDSMLNKRTASKKIRSTDSYSPGGIAGLRPDRATIVYSNRIRECWPEIPIIIGGIEASLRRFSHYDYWSDSIRRSILVDSQADLLVYGMGESQVKQIADLLAEGISIKNIQNIAGTCYLTDNIDESDRVIHIPSHEDVVNSKLAYAKAFKIQYLEQDPIRGKTLVQAYSKALLVQNPPAKPLSNAEMDRIYGLPYMRTWHPLYDKHGGIPAFEEVRFSLTSHRGCFGSCSFCAITAHQGRIIQYRSHKSLIQEAKMFTASPGFKGYIHDVGGPTANFRHPSCRKQLEHGTCRERQCLFPSPCPQLDADHTDYLKLLQELRALPGVKKVFIRSGIRYDYLMKSAQSEKFLESLCEHHVSGQLKVAPEHVARSATSAMQKSGKDVFSLFLNAFRNMNKRLGKEQYLVPYLMCSHPGTTLLDAIELAEYLRSIHYHPEQVQEFIPTPGSLSACMYYTGQNPLTGQKIHVPKSAEERQMQRALLQFRNPRNRQYVLNALKKANRTDLIGYDERCLLKPERKTAPFSGKTRRNKEK